MTQLDKGVLKIYQRDPLTDTLVFVEEQPMYTGGDYNFFRTFHLLIIISNLRLTLVPFIMIHIFLPTVIILYFGIMQILFTNAILQN